MRRRSFLLSATAGFGLVAQNTKIPESILKLHPMTGGVMPITHEERLQRLEKARSLMRLNKFAAIYIGPGSGMFYFTGTRTGAGLVISAQGEPVLFNEAKSAVAEVRAIDASKPMEAAIAQVLTDRQASTGRLGLEEQVPFSIYDGLGKLAPSLEMVSADSVTIGCRVIKSPAEIALMQHATDVTIAAYRAGLATLREGMTQIELRANINAAYRALGYSGEVSVSFGKYTAYPHGSIQPQKLVPGDVVQIDDGCSVDGYQSDVTRTVVFGKPTARQIDVWNLEHKAQASAFAAAQPGATCESVDAAARNLINAAGFGPGYKVPGLPHRTGHGIGLDIHEWTYLVKGNKTRIEPGMCFSDEPMIAIYGEFGIRLEDCMYITPDGPRMFSKPSPSIDQPFG